MKTRVIVVAMALMATTLVAVGPASAHHDDGKGNVAPPTLEEQAQEFENVVASKAPDDSNAPKSFAPCIEGMAAKTFPCDGIDMLSHLTLADLGLSFVNDMWGWTDPATRKDYALVGGTEGTVFVDISDPKRPDVVGMLAAHTLDPRRPYWRDIKVYANHAYVVSEQRGHGLQAFDLTQLRGVEGEPVAFSETAHYDHFGSAHNLNINTDTGFAYVVGTNTCEGGLHMVDLSEPASPDFAGCFGDHGYVHDTQCVVYEGPDADYRGRELCFNSAAEFFTFSPEGIVNTLSIVDVTDKANPVGISRTEYANDGYSHQGWLTPDQSYFLHGDELDEYFYGNNTRTRIWDVRDLDAPSVIGSFENDTTSIDHNLYTEGNLAYASNYTSGLRVYDTSAVSEGELSELAFFDMYPENNNASFEGGTWSNYPYFRQKGIVGVSSMDRGLFVLKLRGNGG